MANDPRDHDASRLLNALQVISRDVGLRASLIDWLLEAERVLQYGDSVRNDITGPIIDALHNDHDKYSKTLADGTRFEFLYRTKIARDFLLSRNPHPSHVWEPQTTRLLKYLAEAGTSDVLIGGAYFGDHAVILGKMLQGTGRKVHCFEPNLAQSSMLKINGELNSLQNLRISTKGLWNESSRHLELQGFDSFANAIEVESGEEAFETITIDDYCKAADCRLSVIMLDIEGAELNALKGAANVLQRERPNIVFEVHRDYVDWTQGLLNTPICKLMTSHGYTCYAIRDFNSNQEMGDRLIELIPAESVYLEGPPHGFNMLAVADPQLAKMPLFREVSGVSPKLLRHKSPALHHPADGMPPEFE